MSVFSGVETSGIATTRGPLVAVLERVGQVTHCYPPLNSLLRSLMTSSLLPDPRRGGQLTKVAEALYRRIDDPQHGPGLAILAGMEEAARRLFRREGFAIVLAGERPQPLPAPDLGALSGLGPVDAAVLDLVRRGDRGVIAYDADRVDPSLLIAQAVLAFPAETFAIICKRRCDVQGLASRLRPYVPGVRWLTGDSTLGVVGRVVVSTPLALGNTAARLWERGVVVCTDAAAAIGADSLLALRHASRARLYALRDHAAALAPRDRDRVAQLFGFEEVNVPRHGHQMRPVEVAFRRVVGGQAPGIELDGVALKRQGIWRHGLRNRLIARLARDLAAGDGDALRGLEAPSAFNLQGPVEPSIAVLVENPEHALALAAVLPGWPVVTAAAADLTAAEDETLTRARRIGPAAPARAIATLQGLGSIAAGRWDVVVRADGGVGVPPRLAASLIPGNQTGGPLVLVDFMDLHHPELTRRSRVRRDEYRRRGGMVDGTPAPTAVDRFLATRPGRPR